MKLSTVVIKMITQYAFNKMSVIFIVIYQDFQFYSVHFSTVKSITLNFTIVFLLIVMANK